MEIEIGKIYQHRLTKEKVLIVGYYASYYKDTFQCRRTNFELAKITDIELEEINADN